jgi:hypothetical protein
MKFFEKPKIVIINEYYAIRKISFGFESYQDLHKNTIWWSRGSICFNALCLAKKEKVKKIYDIYYGPILDYIAFSELPDECQKLIKQDLGVK